MEHLLLKAFRRVKHCRPDSTASFRRDKLRTYSRGLRRGESASELENSLGYNLVGADSYMKRLAAIAKRGVPLATAMRDTLAFDRAGLSISSSSYYFYRTINFWYMAATGKDVNMTTDASQEVIDFCGFIKFNGRLIPKRDLVISRDGSYINKQYAEETLWGITANTHRIATTALGKRIRALLPAGTVLSKACYLVPADLLTSAFNLDVDSMTYTDNGWAHRTRSAAFNITGLGNYHSSRSHTRSLDPLREGDIRIGLEVELELEEGKRRTPTAVAVAKYLNKVIHPRYTLVEEDGSVHHGFELVTSPATIQFHKAAMLTLAQAVVGKGERTNPLLRCRPESHIAGTHIHVDRRSVKNWRALSALFNTAAYESNQYQGNNFRSIMFGRAWNRFAVPYQWLAGTVYAHQNGKYRPINAEHKATYEARVFSSSNDPLVLLGHIEVMHAAVVMTNTIIGTPHHRLTAEAFATYIVANKAAYPLAAVRAEKYLNQTEVT
jgi:hypothetical protein